MPPLIPRCAPLVLLAALVACGAAAGYEELCRRAETALDEGRIGEAWEAAATARQSEPARPRAYGTLVRIGLAHDRAAEALELVEQRLVAGGDIAGLLLAQGQLLVALDRKHDAEQSLREAIRLQPMMKSAYSELSSLLGTAYRYGEAVELLLGAPSQISGDPAIRTRAGALLSRQRRFDEARSLLADVVADHPDFASARFFLGNALLLTDRNESARDQLLSVVEQSPGFTLAWYQLAHAYERLGDLEQRNRALQRFTVLYRDQGAGNGEIR